MSASRFQRRDALGRVIEDAVGTVQPGQTVAVRLMLTDGASGHAPSGQNPGARARPVIFDVSNPLTWGDARPSGSLATGAVGGVGGAAGHGQAVELPAAAAGTQLAGNEFEAAWVRAQAERDVAAALRKQQLANAWREGSVPPQTSSGGQVTQASAPIQGEAARNPRDAHISWLNNAWKS